MKEKDRNKLLMLLIIKLNKENDVNSLALLKTMVENDTPSMKNSFRIMMESTPLAYLLGIDKLSDL